MGWVKTLTQLIIPTIFMLREVFIGFALEYINQDGVFVESGSHFAVTMFSLGEIIFSKSFAHSRVVCWQLNDVNLQRNYCNSDLLICIEYFNVPPVYTVRPVRLDCV